MMRKHLSFSLLSLLLVSPLWAAGEGVLIHPFQKQDEVAVGFANRGIKLQGRSSGELGLADRTTRTLRSWGLNGRIQALPKQSRSFNLFSDDRIQTVETNFAVDGFPLCQYQVKTHETLGGQVAMLGQFPRVEVNRSFSASDWIADVRLQQTISETLGMKGLDPHFHVDAKSKCLWAKDNELLPVWVVDVESEGLLYAFIADANEVYRFEPKHFHASARTRIYPNNEKDANLEDFTIREMKTDGYLDNAYFVTCVPAGSGSSVCPPNEASATPYSMVKEPSLTYTYNPAADESKFAQTSVFTNANRTLEWLEDHGYTNFGTAQIRLAIHASFGGDTNNALYEPRSSFAVIYVGDGDGQVLQNLATDADVVSHELGHHVVYNSVKRIEGESLILHEGLADYFTFARTGNACLGESICPDTSIGVKVCARPRQCLRSAENDLTLNGPNFPKEPHLRGQLISGMLWDLYKKDGILLNDVTRLALRTVDLMVTDSGYKHFVVGLMLADQAIFQGRFCSTLLNRANSRGFQTILTGITCEDIEKQSTDGTLNSTTNIEDYLGPDGNGPTVAPASPPRKGGKAGCGVIAAGASGHDLSALLLWILPLLPVVIRRFRR